MCSGTLVKKIRRFLICLFAVLVVAPGVFSSLDTQNTPILRDIAGFVTPKVLAFNNPDIIDFDPQPVLDNVDESDPVNTIFYYHYANSVDYNKVNLTWYLTHGFNIDDNLNKGFITLKQNSRSGPAVTTVSTDWIFDHTQKTDISSGNPINGLHLQLISKALKPSTTYVMEIKKGFTFKNGAQTTSDSIFTFTTTATSAYPPPTPPAGGSPSDGSSSGGTTTGGSSTGGSTTIGSSTSSSAKVSSSTGGSTTTTSSKSGSVATSSSSSLPTSVASSVSSGMPTAKGINNATGVPIAVTIAFAVLILLFIVELIAWIPFKKSQVSVAKQTVQPVRDRVNRLRNLFRKKE